MMGRQTNIFKPMKSSRWLPALILGAGVVVIVTYFVWTASRQSRATIVVLAYTTLAIEQTWETVETTCASSQQLTDEAVLSMYGLTPSPAIHTRRLGQWLHVYSWPSDYGGESIYNACDGEQLFGGSIIWSGSGGQTYPTKPASPPKVELIPESDVNAEPREVLIDSYWLGRDNDPAGETAWRRAARIPKINSILTDETRVFVHFYPQSAGIMDPSTAHWVVVFVND